jgi:hypothetical protein
MKTRFLNETLPAAMALLALAGAAWAQDNGCQNLTLRGDYAFTVSGQILNADGTTTTRNGVALTHFNGDGTLTQVDYVTTLTPGHTPPGGIDTAPVFRTSETGTYTVNSDCTGSAEIDFPPHPGGAVIKLTFVLGNHAQTIHTVVSSLTPPGAPGPVPVSIRSDGEKLGVAPSIASESE